MDYHNNYGERIVKANGEVKDTRIHPGVHVDSRDGHLWVVEGIEDFGKMHPLFFNIQLKSGIILLGRDSVNYYEIFDSKAIIKGTHIVAVRLRDLDCNDKKILVPYHKFKKYFTEV